MSLQDAQGKNSLLYKRYLSLKNVLMAKQISQEFGITLHPSVQRLAKTALDDLALPLGYESNEMIDAAEYLRLRGHSPGEIDSMCREFGKSLRLAKEAVTGTPAPTQLQKFGRQECEVRRYHIRNDAPLLAAVYEKFTERSLYKLRVRPDTLLQQRVNDALEGTRGFAVSSR
jgi:hypothetical protein